LAQPSLRGILESVSSLEDATRSTTEHLTQARTWLVLAAMGLPEVPSSTASPSASSASGPVRV
jgi:hypothetical protein